MEFIVFIATTQLLLFPPIKFKSSMFLLISYSYVWLASCFGLVDLNNVLVGWEMFISSLNFLHKGTLR